MKPYFLIAILLICNWSIAQQSKCNRMVRYNHLKAKLDSSICIPVGYHIMGVDDADLNNDGNLDKAVRWQKIKMMDGDTVFYSIYLRIGEERFSHYKKLDNVKPLYFKNYESNTNNRFYDSIKLMYTYPTLSLVEFSSGTIAIEFYTEATTLKKLFFTYSPKQDTWILTSEMQWLIPPKNYEGDEVLDENGRKLEYNRAPDQPMRIEDFDMLKYIGW